MLKKYLYFFLILNCFNSILALSDKDYNRQNKPEVVFLTGAAGFIGSNFLKYMFDKYPNYNFIVLDALTYAGNLENIPDYIKKSKRFRFHYGSVTNENLVNKLTKQSDYIVHFAAETHVTRSIYDDKQFFETDVIGTRNMMRALVKYRNKVKRFIHISTSEVLGSAECGPMHEDHAINPRSPYAAAKAGADRLVYAYCCTYDIPALIIRPFNNYGPQQHLEKCIPRFITSAIKKEKLTVHGAGTQTRDWLHTFDLARALDLALHIEDFSKIKNQVIHIGSGKGISVIDIAKLILKEFNLPDDEYTEFIGDRPGQVECHISSITKAKDLLGWEPTIEFNQGLRQVISWYKENNNYWQKMEMFRTLPINAKNGKLEKH